MELVWWHRMALGLMSALAKIAMLTHAVESFGKGGVHFQKRVMGSDIWPRLADEAIADASPGV